MWLVAGLGLLVAGSAIAVDRARLDLSESDFGIGQALVVASSVVGVVALVLSEREAGVVRLRFGLTDGQPRTLDEIGQVYGVTRERIRQIESKTMSKLRHPSRSQVLRDYLD